MNSSHHANQVREDDTDSFPALLRERINQMMVIKGKKSESWLHPEEYIAR